MAPAAAICNRSIRSRGGLALKLLLLLSLSVLGFALQPRFDDIEPSSQNATSNQRTSPNRTAPQSSNASPRQSAPQSQNARGGQETPPNQNSSSSRGTAQGTKYLIGVGKADITGPVVGLTFAGYAHTEQVGSGLRQRLYSRAFIIGDTQNPKSRIVYCVLDNLVGDSSVRLGVLEALEKAGEDFAMYNTQNIAIAAVHSHATPGAWWNYFLTQIPNNGFDKQSYSAVVEGVVLSIKRAHKNIQQGYLDAGRTEITNAAINRSLWAYLQNPAEERKRYKAETDQTMTLIRFRRASDMKMIGVLNWFPVHGTALYGNNTHVAGDNKGLAAWMTEEQLKNSSQAAPGFIAAYSQANLADASPNTGGAWCEDGSGKPCSLKSAACPDGKATSCHGRGPRFRAMDLGVSSCEEIASIQARAAIKLINTMDKDGTPIQGNSVKGFHYYLNMAWHKFNLPNGTQVETCPAALGFSFAAGTTDGPGLFDFIQGDAGRPSNPLWKIVFGFSSLPSLRQKRCQAPKPVLFNGGEQIFPYAWQPNIVDISLFRVGQLVMILSPSEVSTMSGRRWRAAIGREAAKFLPQRPIVVIASPVNSYAHYLTTPEEYSVQRYEGAATVYGKHALDAYINATVDSLHYLKPGSTDLPEPGKKPPDNRRISFNLNSKAFKFDGKPYGKQFGEVLKQPKIRYHLGDDVQATFQGASPRNNLRQEMTFLAVEKLSQNGTWVQVRDDEDWFLVYSWRSKFKHLGYSEVTATWETRGNAEPGTYRIKYYGDFKSIVSFVKGIKPFTGSTDPFRLVGSKG
ncbi:hypothetical protein HIM_04609 [Hirsutella minnesotensis 3608]|uniref:Neutral ceramidase n=1 Tax=Hirsutella minnesotensis 3608 TaxID=1043627 RepID=A0A0F7ZV81_9HYPO|nr:hypothetical protein HIM_04609 [Hirsutella minnesotensis 3608]